MQAQSFAEANNGIINGNSKCYPVSPASPFSSRSLTPSPQHTVYQPVMSATGPVLQLYQPATATRATTVATAAITPQPKNKPPQQILPKPITNIMTQTAIKPQPTQTSAQTAGTLLLNQMIPNAGVIVGQQTSTGVQIILKSPSPQPYSASVPKAQVVVSSNGTLTTSPNTVFVQANRSQPQQVVRLINGQSLQLQQVQTSSGLALVAVPSIQPTLQQATSTHTATVVPSVATVPVQTSVFNQNVIKKTTNHVNSNSNFTSNQFSNISSVHSNSTTTHSKKKKRKEEETTKLDLANLIKISGIDEEDGAPTPSSISSTTSSMSSLSSLSSSPSVSSSPPVSCTVQTQSPPVLAYQTQRAHEPQTNHYQSEQQTFHQKNQFSSRPSTPKQNGGAPLIAQLQTPATQQCGLRFSIGEDGQVILQQQQPQIPSQQSVTASVAAAAQTQLAQLVAEHGGHILQTAVLSLTGSESIVLKTPTGFALRQSPQQVVLQRASGNPTANVVLASSDPSAMQNHQTTNGVRILTDVGGLNGLAGKVLLSGGTVQDHHQNRVQIVAAAAGTVHHQNPNTVSLTSEQQRVQIVTAATATGVPDLGGMSLTTTTEQQNHLQILTSVPSATTELSLTEQQHQNRMEIISNVPSGAATSSTESKNRIQVIPNTRTVSLTEQLVSEQILTNVPSSSSIHEQNSRMIFQQQHNATNSTPDNVHISSSERTDTMHITSATAVAAASACETQTTAGKVRVVTANLPQTYSIALNEQNRYQLIANPPATAEYTVEEKPADGLNQKLEQQINFNEQRIQITSESASSDHQAQQLQQSHRIADNQNRFHVISNVEQQRFMQVNEEQNRIIVASSIEHQRVLNTTSAAVYNEQQNHHVQMVTNGGGGDQQSLLQQLSEEQRKIHIFTNVPTQSVTQQQHRIVQLNEHQKLMVKNVDGLSEQILLQQHQQQQQQLQQQKIPTSTNQLSFQQQHGVKVSSTTTTTTTAAAAVETKLPENNDGTTSIAIGSCDGSNNAGGRFAGQYLMQHGKLTATECSPPMKSPSSSRCNSFNNNTGSTTIHVSMNGSATTIHQNFNTNNNNNNNANSNNNIKSNARTNVACSPSSVISPRCTPSPHSPHFNQQQQQQLQSIKSPSSANHSSPQPPAVIVASTQNIISSCFTNRPNLTVVTQSSPMSVANNQNQLDQQNAGGPPHAQVKPCPAVISHSNVSGVLGAASVQQTVVGNCLLQQQQDFTNDRFVQPSLASPSSQVAEQLQNQQQLVNSPPVSNSFLDSIVQSHPNISINKTGIVQPCSKPYVMRAKKPKKSAVVKPMVFQSDDKDKCHDGPACLNPVASNDGSHVGGVVQRVQTIQLTPQKQQNLKIVQNQIAVLSGKKTRTPLEQATLQKLFNEQQKILLSGKIIPTVPGQNTQGLTFVSTPVRLVPPPTTPPSPHPPSTPPTCNKATSPLHVQVGTQTTLDEPIPPLVVPPAVASLPPPAPCLPLEPIYSSAPTCVTSTATSTTLPYIPVAPQPAPVSPPVPVLPKLTPTKRASLIHEQFEIDQRGATQPDTHSPFSSTSDACKRLLRYHCLDEPILSEKDLEKADEIFEATAKHLLDKNAQMLNKYSYLICKESMREVQTSELIMLGRMFVADETQSLDQRKQELIVSSNPSPPTCSIATQVDDSPFPVQFKDSETNSSPTTESSSSSACQLDSFISSNNHQTANDSSNSVNKLKRDYDDDDYSSPEMKFNAAKKHCPDDEEINAQVQSAIDSILNLQRSDPATDEAVRSILPS
ncbi:mucin-5AC-like [Planococcus citri]|uniref:mucin-5AC-like n=1 Tax=Planococcus citri TaxID=170843 RepID=UPI0031F82224